MERLSEAVPENLTFSVEPLKNTLSGGSVRAEVGATLSPTVPHPPRKNRKERRRASVKTTFLIKLPPGKTLKNRRLSGYFYHMVLFSTRKGRKDLPAPQSHPPSPRLRRASLPSIAQRATEGGHRVKPGPGSISKDKSLARRVRGVWTWDPRAGSGGVVCNEVENWISCQKSAMVV